jgi:L-asparagine transporter-like permease
MDHLWGALLLLTVIAVSNSCLNSGIYSELHMYCLHAQRHTHTSVFATNNDSSRLPDGLLFRSNIARCS